MIQMNNLAKQYLGIKSDIDYAIQRVLYRQSFILGEEVDYFEKEIEEYLDCKHAIGVSSGTDALLISLMAIGIEEGDEVITSPYSFFSTASAIARLGAVPVFVDIYAHDYNINADKIESAITEKTRAIIPVHIAGKVTGMRTIMEIAEKYDLRVIEDACQAIGATYDGKYAGTIGNAGCFSFYPTKNLGGYGDSGMVVTNDDYLAKTIRVLRNHGQVGKYNHQLVGGNFRMDELQAAILRAKLKYLDKWNDRRMANAKLYKKCFAEMRTLIEIPEEHPINKHTYHLYMIGSDKRNKIQNHLLENGIESAVYYPLPLHLQHCFLNFGYGLGEFPESEKASRRSLAIPVYPELEKQEIFHVVETIHSVVGSI